MSVDVTVVVPVFNPGPYIETCIEGILSQSIPEERLETIFVDDGSTDDTPDRLDRLAADQPNITVVHQPNSGWPGKPRNVGIDAARGEYVFFCDHDDLLGVEALERMVAMARRTNADVLIPKMVSRGRPVPHRIFRSSMEHATIVDGLMESMTPHKLFRRSFLNEHGLRFPEGKVRLEDHVFVTAAYLAADVVSVLADYPCYYRMHRDDDGNAALQEWDAEFYFRFVAEVLDIIDARTTPGEARDALLIRPYGGELLGKLTDKRMLKWDDEQRRQIFDVVRGLVTARFPQDFEQRLPIIRRLHAQALLADRLDLMLDVASASAAVVSRAVFHRLSWSDERWIVDFEAELLHDDGSPIRLIPAGARWALDPRLIPSDLDTGPYERDDIEAGYLDVIVAHQANGVEWYVPAQTRTELIAIDGDADNAHRLVVRGTADIDPGTVAGGASLSPGRWHLRLRMDALGIARVARPERDDNTAALPPAGLFGKPVIQVLPSLTKRQSLGFDVDRSRARITTAILRGVTDLTLTPVGGLQGAVDLTIARSARPLRFVFFLVDEDGNAIARRRGRLKPTASGSVLATKLIGQRRLPPGRFRIAISRTPTARTHLLGAVDIDRSGQPVGVERLPSRPIDLLRRQPKPPPPASMPVRVWRRLRSS
jgi:poly(ribitol-phosphate) beta-N-acetylglucosaminyltransferase